MSDARLVEKLASGHFYDYEQQVKTLFFKYKMRKREKEMKELITRAMDDLNSHQQVSETFSITICSLQYPSKS